jgi:hypothetical protein
MADFTVRDEGSIFLLTPESEQAKAWIEENLPADRLVFAGSVVVEHRYIADIIEGIMADGMDME